MRNNGYLSSRKEQLQRITHRTTREAVDLVMWLSVVALNNMFGFGAERAQKFIDELNRVAAEHDKECAEDYDLAKEHLRRRLEQILQCDVRRVD